MTPAAMAARLQPLLDRVYTGHCALLSGDNPPVATPRPLTAAKVEQHCDTLRLTWYGVYPIAPGEDTTRCAVLDLDSHGGKTSMREMVGHARRILSALALDGLDGHPWRSGGGKGLHLIFLWDEPQDAYSVRRLLISAIGHLGFKNGTKGGVAGGCIEVFPKQDSVPADGFGNMFVLPWAKKSLALDPLTWETMPRGDCPEWRMSDPVPVLARPEPRLTMAVAESATGSEILAMLEKIPNEDLDYEGTYLPIMQGVHHATGGSDEGLQLFESWASRNASNKPELNAMKWASFAVDDGSRPLVTINSVKRLATENGWREDYSTRFALIDPETDSSVDITGEAAKDINDPSRAGFTAMTDKNGHYIPSRQSVSDALRFGRQFTKMAIRYDGFLARMVRDDDERGTMPFEDEDYTLVAMRLEKNADFKDIPDKLIRAAVRLIGKYQTMDSAQDWLRLVPEWDGVERIEGFYHHYLGCVDTAYARALGLYQWTAMAGRVMDPGCKADIVPIWVGAQGTRKTSSVEALVPDRRLFGEVDLGLKDADFARKIRGKLVGEISELRGLATRDRESVRALITRTHEEWTEKYVEMPTLYARRIFLIGTSNEDDLLDDPAGNRRFAPVRTGECDPSAIERDRLQLWAEGLARWKADGILWQDVERLAVDHHVAFAKVDPWCEPVENFVEQMLKDQGSVKVIDVMEGALYLSRKDMSRAHEQRIGAILRKLGMARRQSMVAGERAWRWFPAQ